MPTLTGTLSVITGGDLDPTRVRQVVVRAPDKRASLGTSDRLVTTAPARINDVTGEISVDLEPGPALLIVNTMDSNDVYELYVTADMTLLTEAAAEAAPAHERSWVESQLVQLRTETETLAGDAVTAAGTATTAAGQAAQDRAHVDSIRQTLDEAAQSNVAPYLTDAALKATYGTKAELAEKVDQDALPTAIATVVDPAFDRVEVPQAGTWAEIGDSITARNRVIAAGSYAIAYLETGWGTHLRAALGQRGHMVGMFAISGKQAIHVLNEQVPQVLALNPRPAICHVLCGTNDIGNGATVVEVTVRLTAIYDALYEAGIHVIAGLITPRTAAGGGTPEIKAKVWAVNKWIRDQAATRRRFDVVDYYSPLSAPDGEPAPGVMADGLHQSAAGAALMARAATPVFDRLLPAYKPLPLAGDPSNIVPNPFNTGKAGTMGTGATGVVATSFWLAPLAAGTVVASKEARQDSPGDWQVLAVESGDWRLTRDIPLASIEVGQTYIARVELEMDGEIRPQRVTSLFSTLGEGGLLAESCYHELENPVGPVYFPPRMTMQTPPLTVPTNATGGQLQVRLYGAAGGTFRVGRVEVVKV